MKKASRKQKAKPSPENNFFLKQRIEIIEKIASDENCKERL